MISRNSQLGLRLDSNDEKKKFLMLLRINVNGKLTHVKDMIKLIDDHTNSDGSITIDSEDENEIEYILSQSSDDTWDTEKYVNDRIGITNIIDRTGSSYYLITKSVIDCAEAIKIRTTFTSTIFSKLKHGKYTYLLGKNTMARFVVVNGAIKGFYYDIEKEIATEFGLDTISGKHYNEHKYNVQFSKLIQIMTFVELGDIEVVELAGGKNNGKPKDQKIHNSSNNTVYVVDSTWNQILIRTEGFAVRGHFRLQACGVGLKDRKLTWINAFEKLGYTRRPKGEIVK